MSDTDTLTSAKMAVGELLRIAGIAEVICVDDLYGTMPVEDVIQKCVGMPNDVFTTLPHVGKLAGMRGGDNWQDAVRDEWQKLTPEERQQTSVALRVHLDKEDYNLDQSSAQALDFILEGKTFSKLTLDEWRARKPSLEGAGCGRTLVLLDQDMHYGGGRVDQGILEVEALVKGGKHPNVIAGLVSHGADVENEPTRWTELSNDHGISKDKFLLTSKRRLTSDPAGFAFMLKLTVLTPVWATMKERVQSAITDSVHSASLKLDEFNVHDLDHVVLKLPQKEGSWEPDMLVRLFGIYQRADMLAKMKNDSVLGDTVARARSISAVETKSPAVPQPSSRRIQHDELYEAPSIINGLHLPIELGDIFERTGAGNKGKFILLANPCNLMVRSKGRRASGVEEALLAEVVDKKPGHGDAEDAYARYSELPYFDSNSSDPHWIDFRRVHSVRLKVLDLCVYNDGGTAQLATNSSCPADVIPPWRKRHERLLRWVEGLVSQCTVSNNTISTHDLETARGLQSSSSGLFLPSIDTVTRTLTYNGRRIDRLCRVRAFAALAACAAYHTRPAFEQDIGGGSG